MKVRSRTFSGGYRFKNFAGEPKEELVEMGIPEKVIIPLIQEGARERGGEGARGREVPPIVEPGEFVKAGQIIGVDDDSSSRGMGDFPYISNPVHSTVNGIVEGITTIEYPDREVSGVIIESDGTSHWEHVETRHAVSLQSAEWTKLSRSDGTSHWERVETRHAVSLQSAEWARLSRWDIERILYLSGVASLDREGIPTRYKSSAILPDDVQHIIVRGVDSEVYNPSLNVLLSGEKISHFVQGLKMLNRVMPSARMYLALDMYQRQLIKQISLLMEGCNWIDVFRLEPKYPQEFDEVIIPTILNKELPYGHSAAQMGVVVLSIQTILHVYEAVVEGKPVIERVVALGGTGFKENHHVRVRIGTPLEHLIRDRVYANKDVRFVLNSALTGVSLQDLSLPVDRQFTSIIALPEETNREFLAFVRPGFRRDSYSRTFLSTLSIFKKECNTNIHGEERPCISCGFCDEVCPARIIPHLIYKYVERNAIDEALVNLRIFDCIECNLCSYVCPSKIPLARFIKEGKEKLIEEGYVGQF